MAFKDQGEGVCRSKFRVKGFERLAFKVQGEGFQVDQRARQDPRHLSPRALPREGSGFSAEGSERRVPGSLSVSFSLSLSLSLSLSVCIQSLLNSDQVQLATAHLDPDP